MTATTESATHYLTPPGQYFWQWSDAGEVITWANGSTIAFREELLQVLENLAPRGLPPLGAVLLVLAACREGWDKDDSNVGILSGLNHVISQLDLQGKRLPEASLPQLTRRLDEIHRLPRELRTRQRFKNALLSFIFELAPSRIMPENAGAVLRMLKEGFYPEPDSHDAASLRLRMSASFQQDLRCLQAVLLNLDLSDMEQRLRTGLASTPEAAELDMPNVERVQALLAELESDADYGGLARIARNLMALTYLPRKMSEPEESSVGGVSDVANRGSLDRLLVTELANDDLTLAMRVALNEALYLRREAPPRSPLSSRGILIDAGIRLWGLPRVFALSTALAFAAAADTRGRLQVQRPAGRDLTPVDLGSRAGLTEHLEALAAEPHPGPTLGAWLSQWPPHGALDALLVTHAATLQDAGFARQLETATLDRPIYLATVDGGGDFALYTVQGRSLRQMRTAHLDLEHLLAPPESRKPDRQAPKAVPEVRRRWPAALTLQSLPLLLPYTPRYSTSDYCAGIGLASATADQRLVLWSDAYRGCRELSTRLPAGKVRWLRMNLDGTIFLLSSSARHGNILYSYNLATGDARLYELSSHHEGPIQGIYDHVGCIYLVYHDQVDVFSKSAGDFLDTLKVGAGVKWQHDRFFMNWQTRAWFTTVYDGQKAHWQEIPLQNLGGAPASEVLTVFDRARLDGPWAVLGNGDVVSTVGGGAHNLKFGHLLEHISHVLASSRDGNRLIVLGTRRQQEQPQKFLLDLHDHAVSEIHGKLERNLWSLEPAYVGMTQTFPGLRHRFSGVGLTDDGRLALRRSRGQKWDVLTLRDDKVQIVLLTEPESRLQRGQVEFVPVEPPEGMQISLRLATFSDGSQVFLDGRGLLHLLPTGDDAPSITIALASSGLAVWLSDARCCGHRYLLGDLPHTDAAEIFYAIQRFTARVSL